jgi:hypothetical protein
MSLESSVMEKSQRRAVSAQLLSESLILFRSTNYAKFLDIYAH